MGVSVAAIPKEEKDGGRSGFPSAPLLQISKGDAYIGTRSVIIVNMRRPRLNYCRWPPLSWLIMPLCGESDNLSAAVHRGAPRGARSIDCENANPRVRSTELKVIVSKNSAEIIYCGVDMKMVAGCFVGGDWWTDFVESGSIVYWVF